MNGPDGWWGPATAEAGDVGQASSGRCLWPESPFRGLVYAFGGVPGTGATGYWAYESKPGSGGWARSPHGGAGGDGRLVGKTTCPFGNPPHNVAGGLGGLGSGAPQVQDGQGGAGGAGSCADGSRGFQGASGAVEIDIFHASDDWDADGVNNDIDNCLTTVNPEQEDRDEDGRGDACDDADDADSDGDGLADVFDLCPGSPGGAADTDRDGRGDECDSDLDGDGVDNAADSCPAVVNFAVTEAGDAQTADRDRDGTADACDPDRDNDGVANEADNCLVIANGDQSDADTNGVGDLCEPALHGPVTSDDLDESRWHNGDVPVTLTASDPSGIATTVWGALSNHNWEPQFVDHAPATDPGAPVQTSLIVPAVDGEDGEFGLMYMSIDRDAIQENVRFVTVRIDQSPPSISATRPPANADGWNNDDVTVRFACQDQPELSGVASCTPTETVSSEGAGQSRTGEAEDRAGNRTTTTVAAINIDKTRPTVTYSGNAGIYDIDETVQITCSATDALSDVKATTCQDIRLEAHTLGDGVYRHTTEATDKAGNSGSGQTSFTVLTQPRGLLRLTRRQTAELQASASRPKDHDVLETVASKLQEAVTGPFWIDASHLAPSDGGLYRDGVRVFDLSREAADKYAGLIGDSNAAVDKARLRELGASVAGAGRLLAATAIRDAEVALFAVNTTKLDQARRQLAEGDKQAANGEYTKAIAQYGDAWASANQASGKR